MLTAKIEKVDSNAIVQILFNNTIKQVNVSFEDLKKNKIIEVEVDYLNEESDYSWRIIRITDKRIFI